jgi:hypothetical protein
MYSTLRRKIVHICATTVRPYDSMFVKPEEKNLTLSRKVYIRKNHAFASKCFKMAAYVFALHQI